MCENIRFLIAQQIEPRARRQECKTCLGELQTPFTHQEGLQSGPQRMKLKYVGCRIGDLLRRQVGGPPVRGLLLF